MFSHQLHKDPLGTDDLETEILSVGFKAVFSWVLVHSVNSVVYIYSPGANVSHCHCACGCISANGIWIKKDLYPVRSNYSGWALGGPYNLIGCEFKYTFSGADAMPQ